MRRRGLIALVMLLHELHEVHVRAIHVYKTVHVPGLLEQGLPVWVRAECRFVAHDEEGVSRASQRHVHAP